MRNSDKFKIKADDILIKLLNDYHQVDASETLSFFSERAKEMLECEPNITEKSRRNLVVSDRNRTVNHAPRHSGNKQFIRENKVYVLRGFYPDTHIPFKMTLVQFDGIGTARGKVILGLKEHHTRLEEKDIKIYEEAVAEALLLGSLISDELEVQYEYRNFKCMRPKGMELYHERKKSKG